MSVGAVLRDWKTASIAYAVVRIAGVVGVSPVRFNDSAGYMHVDLVRPSLRTWPVPLVYGLLGNDANRVIAQAVIGCLCWVLFAALATRDCRFPATLRAVVLLVGLAPQVTRFDSAILSESLAISSAVLLAATLIGVSRSRAWRVPALLAWAFFVFVRPENLVVGAVGGGAALLLVVLRRRVPAAAAAVIIVGLVGLQYLGSVSTVRDLNMYTVLATRVMNDSARYAWFVERGMPNIPGIRYVDGYDYAVTVPRDIREYLRIPDEQDVPAIVPAGGMELARWVHTEAWRTYAHRLLTHPGETWDLVSSYLGPSLDARAHTFLPTTNRAIVPDWVFGKWQWWALATVAGLLSLLLVSRGRQSVVVSALTAMTCSLFPLVTASSGIEQQRHAAVVAVMLRLCALSALSLGASVTREQGPDEQVR